MHNGNLYIVATPIGNLQDISKRAMSVLSFVDAIACEDTRKTGVLLKMLEIKNYSSSEAQVESRSSENNSSRQARTISKPQLLSYYEQNEQQRIPQIITALKNGLSVALVSDAGTPTISDPGFKLVRECIREGIKVESIPGPSSVITALVVSGLPTDKFLFLGFLPKKSGHREKLLKNIQELSGIVKSTIIFFEAPHRLVGTLKEMQSAFGDIHIVVCRELTKMHEEVRREKISDSLAHFEKTNPKGELVLLFNLGERL